MPTILITGGKGFLGSRISKLLTDKRYDVLIPTNQLRNNEPNEVEEYFRNYKIDAIIHTATCYGRNNESWAEIAETNLALPIRLMIKGERAGVKLFINADTFFNEKIVFEAKEHIYAKTKKEFREIAQGSIQEMKMNFANLTIQQMYGPADGNGKFIPFIIEKMLAAPKYIELTSGEQKRDLVYVDDVAQAFVSILEHADTLGKYEEFGAGTGVSVPLKEAVVFLKEIIGNSTELKFGALPYREHELMDSHADISNNAKIEWKATMNWKDGLRTTVESYRNQK